MAPHNLLKIRVLNMVFLHQLVYQEDDVRLEGKIDMLSGVQRQKLRREQSVAGNTVDPLALLGRVGRGHRMGIVCGNHKHVSFFQGNMLSLDAVGGGTAYNIYQFYKIVGVFDHSLVAVAGESHDLILGIVHFQHVVSAEHKAPLLCCVDNCNTNFIKKPGEKQGVKTSNFLCL